MQEINGILDRKGQRGADRKRGRRNSTVASVGAKPWRSQAEMWYIIGTVDPVVVVSV